MMMISVGSVRLFEKLSLTFFSLWMDPYMDLDVFIKSALSIKLTNNVCMENVIN